MHKSTRYYRRKDRAGLTLFEALISAAITAMVALMVYTGFSQTARVKDKLAARQEIDHAARVALDTLTRDLRSAYLSAHVNVDSTRLAVVTGFSAKTELGSTRMDFTTFSHRRLVRNVHEGDACEVGYRVEARRGESQVYDLLRRESPRIDSDFKRGGITDVLLPGIRTLEAKFYDPSTDQWLDHWETTQGADQPMRLPSHIRISITVLDANGRERRYRTETAVMLQDVLRFGLPIDYR